MQGDLSAIADVSLWVAGEAGQTALALSGSAAGLRAAVDQHEAEVRGALPGPITPGVLMSYARGFVDAAVARGWWPTSGDSLSSDGWPSGGSRPSNGSWSSGGSWPSDDGSSAGVAGEAAWADELAGLGFSGDDARGRPLRKLDWESLRLAAVCRLFLETQGLAH